MMLPRAAALPRPKLLHSSRRGRLFCADSVRLVRITTCG